MKILLFFLLFNTPAFAQSHSDSLRIAINSLDQRLLADIQRIEEGGEDYMILRMNDSLGRDDSYTIFYNLDSCTEGYKVYVGEHQVISYNHINFKDRPSSGCMNRFIETQRNIDSGYLEPRQKKVLSIEDLTRTDYLLYGKVGNQYIIEEFDHTFLAEFHSGMVYQLACSLHYGCK